MEPGRLTATAPPRWLAPGVVAVTLAAYVWTLRTGLGFGDSGELVAAAVECGVPHPPGYPVWTLAAHAWTWLPGTDTAWKIALSSAVYMALAAGGVAWLLWRAIALDATTHPTHARAALTAGGALLFAFSTEAWRAATATEVYALHMLLAVAVWARLLQWGQQEWPRLTAVGAGLALGLGLANHQTLLLAAPGYVIFALRWDWRRALRPGMIALFVVPAVLGVATYGLLPLLSARDPIVDWSNTETWQGFWDHLLRHQYRQVGLRSDWNVVLAQLQFFGGWLVREYLGLLPIGAAALIVTWRRDTPAGRAWVLGQAAAFAGAGLFFAYLNNTELDNSNRDVLTVYFMLPGLCALFLAIPALAWWLESGPPERERRAGVLGGAVLALALIQALRVGPRVSHRGVDLGEQFIQHIVTDLPPETVVVAGTGAVHFAMLYAKVVPTLPGGPSRPDLIALTVNRLASPAYREEVENQHTGLVWPTEADYQAAFARITQRGDTTVYGAQKLMYANGYILGRLLQLNPDRTFAYDEGIPVAWVYGNAEPAGMLLRLSAAPVRAIRPEVAARDREFWDALAEKLGRHPAYKRDGEAQRAFSRRRSTIGAWYAWHGAWAEAEYALQQALELSPDNVDAAVKLAMVYAAMGDTARGEAFLETAVDRDPGSRALHNILAAYRAGTARWYGTPND